MTHELDLPTITVQTCPLLQTKRMQNRSFHLVRPGNHTVSH